MAPGDDASDVADAPTPDVVALTEPRDGVPPVVATKAVLDEVIAAMAAANGPVAVDAERASGYRYGQRAYLVQLRRAGAGTALIDPIALPDLSELSDALSGAEWVLHAANQDLPCLAGVGMAPKRLFDTELAGRLAGHERVGLGYMAEAVLGIALAKEHSAADWSRRPLPEPWLRYAALDVEILVDLRDSLESELADQGKLDWALEEFASVASAPPSPPRVDPWRRTSGMHRVRSRRQHAIVRALWHARDAEAQRRDIAPGRLMADAAIVNAALAAPTSMDALTRVGGWGGRGARRMIAAMWPALETALALPDSELPAPAITSDAPPPPNRWADRDPAAAARLAAARQTMTTLGTEHGVPVENLLPPEGVRRLAWKPPEPLTVETTGELLARHAARPWQINLCADPLTKAISAALVD